MRNALNLDRSITSDRTWSSLMADAAIARYAPEAAQWHYEHGLLLKAIEQVWHATGQIKYWHFIKDTLEPFVAADGSIRTYRPEEYNLDQINPGKMLLTVWQTTGDERYRAAVRHLRQQLQHQPRTRSGGFWHKLIYPNQMWLDGIYMAQPFYAEYARLFGEPAAFDDVAQQITLIEAHTRDPHTGLLYHAWDESKQQRWANPETGRSPHVWGRAMGWYTMALVDVLDYLPAEHTARPNIVAILQRTLEAVLKVQDQATGLWYQVLDQGTRAGNYKESSASCMFVYAIAKAVRQAYLPIEYLACAQRAYRGILAEFVKIDDQGLANLEGTCSVAGLGGSPYRDGSYEYYVSEPVATNDYKGVGAFILAAVEIERAAQNSAGL